MDRSERAVIFEPLLLILKSRKGLAAIVSVITSGVLFAIGFEVEQVAMIVSPIFVYIGGQSVVDASESSKEVNTRVLELREELNYLYNYLNEQFVKEDEVKEVEEVG